jgi:hypothetical protein
MKTTNWYSSVKTENPKPKTLISEGFRKCPSVRSGGKPYFFYRRIDIRDSEGNPIRITHERIVWDRHYEAWFNNKEISEYSE